MGPLEQRENGFVHGRERCEIGGVLECEFQDGPQFVLGRQVAFEEERHDECVWEAQTRAIATARNQRVEDRVQFIVDVKECRHCLLACLLTREVGGGRKQVE